MASTFKRLTTRSNPAVLTRVGAYTVAASTSTTVIGLVIANTTTSPTNVDVTHHDGTNHTYIVKNAPIPAGSSLVIVGGDQKVVLQTGDGVFVNTSVASSVDVLMSVLEVS